MTTRNAMVLTTINHPTEAVGKLARFSDEWPLVVVGDNKTPDGWSLENSTFLSISDQRKLPFQLAALLPENHYCRKNLGYLSAIRQGVSRIAETDDDNHPVGWALDSVEQQLNVLYIDRPGWVNIYEYFTDEKLWPRGFPLDEILRLPESPSVPEKRRVSSPIQQYLAAGDPDVDAIYRLTIGKIDHEYRPNSIALSAGSIVPFNSQSTVWFESAFPYLYLPSHVSFRMTDIWRSFVAQVCLWAKGQNLSYHAPGVFQERNQHDLMRDFSDEAIGYRRNAEIMARLQSLSLNGTAAQNLVTCYEELHKIGIVPVDELTLVNAWVADLQNIAVQAPENV